MNQPAWLTASGTSPAAIRHHYDISDEFFALWLGEELVYSCGLWTGRDGVDSLAEAQQRKLDHFAGWLGVRGGRVLDIGCGWGALLERFTRRHGMAGGVGLTLSPAQAAHANRRNVPGTQYLVQSWSDHEPSEEYDAVTCIEATEHLVSDAATADEKVAVYRAFFDRIFSWLRPGGRLGLQLICLDNVGHQGSRPGRGPLSRLIGDDIFPESMPASLSELVLGWETHFELDDFLNHTDHYRRTFRAWSLALRSERQHAADLVGERQTRTFERYFAAGEACFRLREHALYLVVLTRRPEPKVWATALWPRDLDGDRVATGASVRAVQEHYDVSNDFYALWLGPSMMYSSAMWGPGEAEADLERAHDRKLDFFAAHVLDAASESVLDVGCGWGGNLRRLADRGVRRLVGLTLSQAQLRYLAEHPVAGADVRLEGWERHQAQGRYDAIVSYGAFEHFARDGTTGVERVAVYRRFFARCYEWLAPGGRLGLETIANDGAPDTATPRGRGPLGDFVLDLFPESICPQLGELVLGFEPYFEVEELRADGLDFARTFRAWLLRLRERQDDAVAMVGPEVTRRYQRYLAASEIQFRTRAITNYRLVLQRRPGLRV